ncbi:MFS transporter [Streptomyces sp. L2]|uniref:MFS transporter n=1 Tax=Streptomyces sp. L2 TaxID=2162665 RepID=UPI001F50B353|nr:MFS transporter [Streptomyces sp. L2]
MLRNPSFGRVWAGQLLTQAASRMFQVGAVWWLVGFAGGAHRGLDSGLFLMLSTLPAVALAPVVARIVERRPHRAVLACAAAGAGAVAGAAALWTYAGTLPMAVTYGVGLALAACQAVFDPCLTTSVPELVEDADIESATGFELSTQSVAGLAGGLLGPLAVDAGGLSGVVTGCAAGYLLAALLVVSARFPRATVPCPGATGAAEVTDQGPAYADPDQAGPARATDRPPTDADTAQAGAGQASPAQAGPAQAGAAHADPAHAGLIHADPAHANLTQADPTHVGPTQAGPARRPLRRILAELPFIRRVLVCFAAANVFTTAVYVVMPLYTRGVLHSTGSTVASLEAALGAGTLVGSFTGGRLPGRPVTVGSVCLLVMGAALGLPGLVTGHAVALGSLAVTGWCVGVIGVRFVALFQRLVPAADKPGFFAVMQALLGATFPVSSLVFGALGDQLTARTLCLVQGAGLVPVALALWWLGGRAAVRDQPALTAAPSGATA